MVEHNNIQKKLYDIEATPPPGMWNRIAEELDAETEQKVAPVVVMPQAKNNWMRIALAASVLGFIAMTALWLTKKPTETKTPDSTAVTPPVTTIIKDTVYLPQPETATPNTTSPSLVNTNPAPATVLPNTTTVTPSKNNGAVVQSNPANNTQQKDNTKDKDFNLPNKQTPVLVDNNAPKDIIIKDANGNPIRNIEVTKTLNPNNGIAGPDSKGDKTIGNILSKISLASDGEEIDSIINNSQYWKKQIKQWRDKLIKSGYTPNLINSLDFVELKKLLEQE
jgi:hypothetical protein